MSTPNIVFDIPLNIEPYLLFSSTEAEAQFDAVTGKVSFKLEIYTDISKISALDKAFQSWERRGKQGHVLNRAKLRNQIKKETDLFDQQKTISYLRNYTKSEDFILSMHKIDEYYGNKDITNFIENYVWNELIIFKNEYLISKKEEAWKNERHYFVESIRIYGTFENDKINTLFRKYKIYKYDPNVVEYISLKYKELYETMSKNKPIINNMLDFTKLIFIQKIIPKIKKWLIYSDDYYFREENKWTPTTIKSKIPELQDFIISVLVGIENICPKLMGTFIANVKTDNYLQNYLSKNGFCTAINIRISGNIDFKNSETYSNFIKKYIKITNNVEDKINKTFLFQTFIRICNIETDQINNIEKIFYKNILKNLENLITIKRHFYVGCIFNY